MVAKPDKGKQVEAMLCQMAQSGQLGGKLGDDELKAWVYISKFSGRGGGGRLRINLRKVKDLVNNASILTIFSLKLCNFLQNFL